MYSTYTYSDPTYFPFRNADEEEQVVSLSGARYMSVKEALDRGIPIPLEIEEWANIAEMQYSVSALEDQQELQDWQYVSEKGISVDKSTPIENQIVGYNEAKDQCALKSAGQITLVDSSELFQKVSNGEVVEGVKGFFHGFFIASAYQEK